MDGETCIAPLPELNDWAEALALAAKWDAAARAMHAANEPDPCDEGPAR